MKNKLLTYGSITACVVLVLAGLSPVVGFDSVRSSVKDSPLFHLRTQRALDREQNIQTCTYLGKDKNINILFPTRESYRTLQFHRILDMMRMMDDGSIGELIDKIEQEMKEDYPEDNLDNFRSGEPTCWCYTIRYHSDIWDCLLYWFLDFLIVLCFFTEILIGFTI
jgi:hypothetical protein